MKSLLCCVATVLSFQAISSVPAESLEPGRWRVMTTTLSGPQAPPQVATRCLSPDDVADLGKTFGPQIVTENSECKRTAYSLDASGLTWRLQCRGQLDMDVAGQFIFDSSTRYSAFITTRATMADRIVHDTSVSISAERIGECR